VIERITFAQSRIVATFVATGRAADIRCGGRT
jgi:hypothetical protein